MYIFGVVRFGKISIKLVSFMLEVKFKIIFFTDPFHVNTRLPFSTSVHLVLGIVGPVIM